MEIGWSESVEPRFKLHLLDESYAWVLTTHNFSKDFVRGEGELEREAPYSLYNLRRLGGRISSGQELKFIYSIRLCVSTENTRFRRGFTRRVREIKGFGFRECPRDFLEYFSTLQEVGVFSYIDFSSLEGRQWPFCIGPDFGTDFETVGAVFRQPKT